MSVQEAAVFDPIQANDIDAELERSHPDPTEGNVLRLMPKT